MCKDGVVKSVALTDSSAVCCGSCEQSLPVNCIFTPCGGHPICGKCLASLITGWVRCSYTEDCRIAFFSQAGMVKCYDPGCTHSYSPSNLLHAVPTEVFAAYEGGIARAVKWVLKEENLSLIFNNVIGDVYWLAMSDLTGEGRAKGGAKILPLGYAPGRKDSRIDKELPIHERGPEEGYSYDSIRKTRKRKREDWKDIVVTALLMLPLLTENQVVKEQNVFAAINRVLPPLYHIDCIICESASDLIDLPNPLVLHISAHGGDEGMVSSRTGPVLSPSLVSGLVARCESVGGVVLNCCFTEGLPFSLLQHASVEWVIYWSGKVPSSMCVHFTRRFYTATRLAQGDLSVDHVESLFQAACVDMYAEEVGRGEVVPLLLIRGQAGGEARTIFPNQWDFYYEPIASTTIIRSEIDGGSREDEVDPSPTFNGDIVSTDDSRSWVPQGYWEVKIKSFPQNQFFLYSSRPYNTVSNSHGLPNIINKHSTGSGINRVVHYEKLSQWAGNAEKCALQILQFPMIFNGKMVGEINRESVSSHDKYHWLSRGGMVDRNIVEAWGAASYKDLFIASEDGVIVRQALKYLSLPHSEAYRFLDAVNCLKDAEVYRLVGLNHYVTSPCGTVYERITYNIDPTGPLLTTPQCDVDFHRRAEDLEPKLQILCSSPSPTGQWCDFCTYRFHHVEQYRRVRQCREALEGRLVLQ
jgi:hypothetical protein